MKITIDTKEDSHEEIKNIISMLSSLVGSKAISSVSEEKEIVSNKGDIFSQGPSEETYAESPSESSDVPDNPQPSNVFSMFNTPEQNVIESSKEEEDDSAESVIKQEDSKQVDLDLQDLEEYHD